MLELRHTDGVQRSGLPAGTAGSTAAATRLKQRGEQSAQAARRRTACRQRQNVAAACALVACCSWLCSSPVRAAETPAQAAQRVGAEAGPIGVASQALLPALNSFVSPGGYLGADNVSLGNTTFR